MTRNPGRCWTASWLGVAHLFHVYLLSDTSDPGIVAAEEVCFDAFAAEWRDAVPVTYRRRAVNTAFKSGNIRDFCDRWGSDHELAITLDADSFMAAEPVLRLVRIMQANPTLGLLQTLIVGLRSVSAFARIFQFGMRLGMRSFTLGGAWWQGDCGPYWGHNAILRLEPFVAHCRMPVLPQRGPLGGHLLSHDQIEAVLMRRAGYEVRVRRSRNQRGEPADAAGIHPSRSALVPGQHAHWRLLHARAEARKPLPAGVRHPDVFQFAGLDGNDGDRHVTIALADARPPPPRPGRPRAPRCSPSR